MNTSNHCTLAAQSLEERNHLHDLARLQAHALREQAIDDFWRGANAMLGRGAASASRSAQRLAYALARRQARAEDVPGPTRSVQPATNSGVI